MQINEAEIATPLVDEVKVGTLTYQVTLASFIPGADPNAVGEHDFINARILLTDNLSQRAMDSVLWHEIIHAINEQVCNQTMTESEVNMRGMILQQMIMDNKELFLKAMGGYTIEPDEEQSDDGD